MAQGESIVDFIALIVAGFDLVKRAVDLALNDAEFAADFNQFLSALEGVGIDVPGYPASEAPKSAAQRVADESGDVAISNPDGSISLKGE